MLVSRAPEVPIRHADPTAAPSANAEGQSRFFGPQISCNFGESCALSSTRKLQLGLIYGLLSGAFQADDEGSIPFTRSINFKRPLTRLRHSVPGKAARWQLSARLAVA